MTVTHKITNMELTNRGRPYQIHAKQGDSNTRNVEICLYANNIPFNPPDGTKFVVRFKKQDGTSGMYDTMPDGETPAVTVDGNVLFVTLAEQVLTFPGKVICDVAMVNGFDVLGTFDFDIIVDKSPESGTDTSSQPYYKVTSLDDLNAILEEFEGRIESIQGDPGETSHPLKGVHIHIIADSQASESLGNWPPILEQLTGCVCTRDAIPSTRITSTGDLAAQSIVNRAANPLPEGTQIVMYGPMGTNDPTVQKGTTEGTPDPTTIAGAIVIMSQAHPEVVQVGCNGMFVYSCDYVPDVVHNVSTTAATASWTNINRGNIAKWVQMVSEAVGMPCINLWEGARISKNSPECYRTSGGTIDGLHPSAEGCRRIATYVAHELGEIAKTYGIKGAEPTPGGWETVSVTYMDGAHSLGKQTGSTPGLPVAQTSSYTNNRVTLPMDLTGVTTIRAHGWAIGNYGQLSFLDANGAVVEGHWDTGTSGDAGIFDKELPVPSGAVSVIIAGSVYAANREVTLEVYRNA